MFFFRRKFSNVRRAGLYRNFSIRFYRLERHVIKLTTSGSRFTDLTGDAIGVFALVELCDDVSTSFTLLFNVSPLFDTNDRNRFG